MNSTIIKTQKSTCCNASLFMDNICSRCLKEVKKIKAPEPITPEEIKVAKEKAEVKMPIRFIGKRYFHMLNNAKRLGILPPKSAYRKAGNDALLVKCGQVIYDVTLDPDVYHHFAKPY